MLPDRFQLPSRYAPAVFISAGLISFIFSAILGFRPFDRNGADNVPSKANAFAADRTMSAVRAASYIELAATHIAAASGVGLPHETRPLANVLREEITAPDRQMAAIPGSGSN